MAAAGATYLFRGSNIGPDGVLYDTLNIPEMMYILQKKYLGVPNTIPDALYSTEFVPSILDKVPSGYTYLHQTKLYAQTVPLSNPINTLIGLVGSHA
jgi:hypothetical protein